MERHDGGYRRTDSDGNVRLEFKGVSHTGDVFWDGEKIAHHYNAFTPFSVVIPKVQVGIHEICVRVDNTFGEHSALHVPNDYYTYGGITRARCHNNKGVVDEYRRPKEGYDTVTEMFHKYWTSEK